MNIEVDSINKERLYRLMVNQLSGNKNNSDNINISEKIIEDIVKKHEQEIDLQELHNEMAKFSDNLNFLNKKIKLNYNEAINRVIITIIEKETNKVVKEFPSVEIQNLALHLKEAIGILFDKIA